MGINSRRLEPARNSGISALDVEYLLLWIKGLTLVLFLIVFSFYFIPVSNLLLMV